MVLPAGFGDPCYWTYSILWDVGRPTTGTHTFPAMKALAACVASVLALLSIPECSCSAIDLESELSGSVGFHLLLVPISLLY